MDPLSLTASLIAVVQISQAVLLFCYQIRGQIKDADDEVSRIITDVEALAATLDELNATLVSDSLVYRYDPEASPDGLRGQEGTFSVCSFWYVEALTRAGRLDEARIAFEKMLTYANHVGLYAEQIGQTGEQQGNFPQALTHLALISAAYSLDRALR